MEDSKKLINWTAIREEYIYGEYKYHDDGTRYLRFPTHQELGEKYDCHPGTISGKASREKWTNERELYKEKLQESSDEERSQNRSDSARYDIQNLFKLEKIDDLLNDYLSNARQIDESTGELKPVDLKNLLMAVDIITKKHQLTRQILNEPISLTKDKSKIKEGSENKSIQIDAKQISKLAKTLEDKENRLKELQEKRKQLEEQLN